MTGLPGQATYPLPLPDGRLLVFQQRRAETQAMVAVVSADGGRTFDRARRKLEMMAELGAPRLGVCSNVSPRKAAWPWS